MLTFIGDHYAWLAVGAAAWFMIVVISVSVEEAVRKR